MLSTQRHDDWEIRAARVGILGMEAFRRHATHELGRARRYRRPVALVVIELDHRTERFLIGGLVRHLLRRWDLVGLSSSDSPQLLALLPETWAVQATVVIGRTCELAPGLRYGVAAFPADGGTVATLCATAERRCRTWLPDAASA